MKAKNGRVSVIPLQWETLPVHLLWYAGRDSNPQPSEPESDALSIEPPAHFQPSLSRINR